MAHKMDIIDHLHQESLTLKVKEHSDMLYLQYLVNCLEEDHVCHGITTQEPRPMKETLHSRHHSTVLPRHGTSRKESLQNLHTHAVDSGIQLLDNNRVLKECPPPISDEEQRRNRRQRCTLSQLRLGHCHLLQDYKHRSLVNQTTPVQTVELHHKTLLLLFAFRDLWKEWGDSNFQIFSQNCQFHHMRLELL